MINLLLVEDHERTRRGMQQALETMAGFNVRSFKDGQSVMAFLENADVDDYTAVLLDYVLSSNTTGDALLQELREKYPSLKVIVFTGKNITGGLQTLEIGAYRLLQRPINYEELVTLIRDLEQRREMRKVFHKAASEVQELLDVWLCMVWQQSDTETHWQLHGWHTNQNLYQFVPPDEVDPRFLDYIEINLSRTVNEGVLEARVPKNFLGDLESATGIAFEAPTFLAIALRTQDKFAGVLVALNDGRIHLNDDQRAWLNKYCALVAHTLISHTETMRLIDIQANNQILASTLEEASALKPILARAREALRIRYLAFYKTSEDKLMLSESVQHNSIRGLPDMIDNPWNEAIDTQFQRKSVSMSSKEGENEFELLPVLQSKRVVGAIAIPPSLPESMSIILLNLTYQIVSLVGRSELTRSLQEVSRYAHQGNFDELSQKIVEVACVLTGAYTTLLWTPVKRKEGVEWGLEISASKPAFIANEEDSYIPLRNQISFYAHTYVQAYRNNTSEPQVINNTLLNRDLDTKIAGGHLTRWRSAVAIPLQDSEGLPIGLLSLHNPWEDRFHNYELELIQIFSNQVAIALEQELHGRRISLLAEMGEHLSASTYARLLPKSLFDKIAEYACRLLDADCAVLFPYDPSRREFYQIEKLGTYQLIKGDEQASQPTEQGLAQYIKHHPERELFIENIGKLPKEDKEGKKLFEKINSSDLIRNEKIRAFAGIALQVNESEDDQVGLLYIDFRSAHRFTEAEKRVVRLFGRYVANVIRGGMLSHFQADEQALRDALNSAILKTNKEETATEIVKWVASRTECTSASLQRVNLEENYRILLGSFQVPDGFMASIPEPDSDELLTAVLESKDGGLVLPDTAKEHFWNNKHYGKDVRSWMGVALRDDNEVIGLLTVSHTNPHHFSNADLKALLNRSELVAAGIQNADLNKIAENRVRDLKALTEAVEGIRKTLERDKLLNILIDTLWKELDCSHCMLYQVDQQAKVFKPWPGVDSKVQEEKAKPERSFEIGKRSILNSAYQGKQTILLRNSWSSPDFAPGVVHKTKGPRSLLVVPLWVGNEIIGLISADQDEYEHFTNQDQLFAETLCTITSVALMRVRTLDMLQTLNEQALGISETQSQYSIMRQLVYTAKELLNKKHGIIYWMDDSLGGKYPNIVEVAATEYYDEESGRVKYFDPPEPRLDKKTSITRLILKNKTVQEVVDPQDKAMNPELREMGIKSLIGAPMIVGDKVVGVLYVHHDTVVEEYSAAERTTLQIIANWAALLLQRTNGLADAFPLISEAITVDDAPYDKDVAADRIYSSVVAWLRALFPHVDLIEIKRVTRDSDKLTVVKSFPSLEERNKQFPVPEVKIGEGITGWVAKNGEPKLVKDIEDPKELGDLEYIAAGGDYRCELAVPIIGRTEKPIVEIGDIRKTGVIGVINLEHKLTYGLSEIDCKLTEAVAELTSVFIANLEVDHDRQNHLMRSTRLGLIGNEIVHKVANLGGIFPIRINEIQDRLRDEDIESATLLLEKLRRPAERLQEDAGLVRKINSDEDQPLSLKKYLRYAIDEVEDLIREDEDISIVGIDQIPDDLPPVTANPFELRYVFLNLMNNAVQAIRAAKRDTGIINIYARTIEQDGQLCCEVKIRDNGIGIEDELQEIIFDLGYTRTQDGLGLGLWRDQRVILALGGNITVKSVHQEWAEFTITLPAASGAEIDETELSLVSKEAEPEPKTRMLDPEGVNVMVVEDNEEFRDLVYENLVKEGLNVIACSTFEQAIDSILQTHRDMHVAVVDIRLKDHELENSEGFDFIKKLRKLHPKARIIVISALDSYEYVRKSFLQFQVSDFLTKGEPHRWNELGATIRTLVRNIQKESRMTVPDLEVAILQQDSTLQQELKEVLENDGYKTEVFSGYSLIKDALLNKSYGLALLDTNALPSISTLKEALQIRQKETRLLLVTRSEKEKIAAKDHVTITRAISDGLIEGHIILDADQGDRSFRELRELVRAAMSYQAQKFVELTWTHDERAVSGEMKEVIVSLRLLDTQPSPAERTTTRAIRLPTHSLAGPNFVLLRLSIYSDSLTSEIGSEGFWRISENSTMQSFAFRVWMEGIDQSWLTVRIDSGATWLGTLETLIDLSIFRLPTHPDENLELQ